ncbi:hypothetical protein [Alloprevotella tannerae]|uniref:hypothetical protein n=1 Tax=Alloprevotella tannerae TaxID=76122 RepID=UPI0028E8B660|nr:hypothetical protein [Alloprevotella tannerae]
MLFIEVKRFLKHELPYGGSDLKLLQKYVKRFILQSNKPKKALGAGYVNKTKGNVRAKKRKRGDDSGSRRKTFGLPTKRDSRKRELRLRLPIYNNV